MGGFVMVYKPSYNWGGPSCMVWGGFLVFFLGPLNTCVRQGTTSLAALHWWKEMRWWKVKWKLGDGFIDCHHI